MPTIWPKILYRASAPSGNEPMGSGAATVDEMRDIVGAAVEAHRDRGRAEAVFQAARELGLSQRRVVAILRTEVGRVWADELETARKWLARHCEQQAVKLAHDAELYRVRAAALRERLNG